MASMRGVNRLAAVVLGVLVGWVIGSGILLVATVVLVAMGIPPERQIVGVAVAMLVFTVAGGLVGFRLSNRRTAGT